MAIALLLTASAAQPQSANSRTKEWPESLFESLDSNCYRKQLEDPVNRTLKPDAIKEACTCFARRVVDRAKASRELREATKSNDSAETKRLFAGFTKEPDGRHSLLSCTEDVTERRGGIAAISNRELEASASRKPGLAGDMRATFVGESVRKCRIEMDQLRPDKKDFVRDGFCRCYGEGVADRISPYEMFRSARLPEEERARQPYYTQSERACTEKYLR